MTFLAPFFLVAGAGVATAIVLLHFLARQRPPAAVLPTARFVPDRPARWPSRAPRPTDWLLLALRVAAIASIATAFAEPVRTHDRAPITRLILVDRSRAVADERAMRDSALRALRDGDVVVVFDTVARLLRMSPRESLAVLTRSTAPPSLSTALIAAERAAVTMRDAADSIELVVISPFPERAWDNATPVLRARWAGRIRVISVPLARGDTTSPRVGLRSVASDPVRAAAAPFLSAGDTSARLIRERPSGADSAWATRVGHVLVHWPRAPGAEATAQAVVAPNVVLAAPLVRLAIDSAPVATVVARFGDGTPAIVERLYGGGCIRDVGFDLPAAGDVPLRESMRKLITLLAGPCDRNSPGHRASVARLDSLRGTGPLLASSALPRPPRGRGLVTSWLLIAGAMLLLAEVAVRQRAVRT